MKIAYLSTSTIPSRAANSIQVMKMCESFAKQGHEVVLFAPKRGIEEKNIQDVFSFYAVKPLFKIVFLPWQRIPFGKYVYSLLALFKIKKMRPDVIYTRNAGLGLFSSVISDHVIYESHHLEDRLGGMSAWMFKKLLARKGLKKIVVITNVIKDYYIKKHSVASKKIKVLPDGADEVVASSRHDLGGRKNALKAGYVGHLYKGKGMEIIEKIARQIAEVDFHIVGGREEDLVFWKNKLNESNVFFHGFVKPADVSGYISALDICLLPNQKVILPLGLKNEKHNISEFTSPLKLFEYMSHKKAIVASDMPALKEVLKNEENSLLCQCDDPCDWVNAITRLKEDAALRQRIQEKAYNDFITKYTWERRASLVFE